MYIKGNIKKIIKNIKIVFFDFDGVFTNNKVIVSEDGKESVICDRSDGIGLSLLNSINIKTAIISMEKNPVVKIRAKKLNIDCFSGCSNKYELLLDIIKKKNISINQVAYVGNDINDLTCIEKVGLPVAVKDAYPEVISKSKIILKKKGGHGAVRELCDLIYKIHKRGCK